MDSFRKGKGLYWYKKDNYKVPFNMCDCGNLKTVNSKKCYRCVGLKIDGTFKKKADKDKKFKSNGYVYVYNPTHKRANKLGYVAEHILIAEKKVDRDLKEGEIIHHINKKRDDNRIENIMIMSLKDHNKIHNPITNHLKYGKYRSHTLNYCHCGNLKDIRSKKCRLCFYKRFKNINRKDI